MTFKLIKVDSKKILTDFNRFQLYSIQTKLCVVVFTVVVEGVVAAAYSVQ